MRRISATVCRGIAGASLMEASSEASLMAGMGLSCAFFPLNAISLFLLRPYPFFCLISFFPMPLDPNFDLSALQSRLAQLRRFL